MLRRLDTLGIFDNDVRQCSMLLLDVHRSLLGIDFLDYIMYKNHYWTVCTDIPYARHMWQVANLAEQNGCFKMALTRQKRVIIKSQDNKRLCQTDIIPLVQEAWAVSFAWVTINKKAICNRGWNHLNRAMLKHPKCCQCLNPRHDHSRLQPCPPSQRAPQYLLSFPKSFL